MIDKLENIGFYTLCDERALNASSATPMWRCEMLITDKCNFNCLYCRKMKKEYVGDIEMGDALATIKLWAKDGLKHIRFSGGEPTLHPYLIDMIECAKNHGVKRIALSTNGSANTTDYLTLYKAGVNDFSISLDACCAFFGDKMAGVDGYFDKVTSNIHLLSRLTYVTVGMVFTDDNILDLVESVRFAHSLGVADIRIIPAAQYDCLLEEAENIDEDIIEAHPILKYRVNNIKNEIHVRGLQETDSHKCNLLYDDSIVVKDYHFPCIIYFREGGNPIGKVGSNMRGDRIKWLQEHDTHLDPICKENCLDVCIDYNNKFETLKLVDIENEQERMQGKV